MASIEEALYAKLMATGAVTALVGDRVFPESSEQATGLTTAHVTYARAGGVPFHTHDGPGGLRTARMSFTAHALTYTAAKAVAVAVLATLDGFQGTVGTVEIQAILSESDMIDDFDPETRQHVVVTDLMTAYKIGG